MKKILLFATLVVGMLLALQAQTQYYDDVVYLKNGSIIRGVIIEQIPNESIKIQTKDENIFVFKIEEVEKITKELQQSQLRKPATSTNSSSFNKSKGYMGLVEVEGGIGVGTWLKPLPWVDDWIAARAGVSIINGYRVIPQFAVGIGVGTKLFIYTSDFDDYYLDVGMPFFLHLRSDFLDRNISPYIAFNIGYNLSLMYELFNGIFMEPTIGVGFNVGKSCRLNIGLAAAINKVDADYGYFNLYLRHGMEYALNLKVGFSF